MSRENKETEKRGEGVENQISTEQTGLPVVLKKCKKLLTQCRQKASLLSYTIQIKPKKLSVADNFSESNTFEKIVVQ